MYIDNEWATIIDKVFVAVAVTPWLYQAVKQALRSSTMALQNFQFPIPSSQFQIARFAVNFAVAVDGAVRVAVAVAVVATQSPIHQSYKSKHSGLIKHIANSYPDDTR